MTGKPFMNRRHLRHMLVQEYGEHAGQQFDSMVERAVSTEREACAKICDYEARAWGQKGQSATLAADRIRSRVTEPMN